jgi:hypothetical protein
MSASVVSHNKTDSREVHMTTTQIEDTATYPSKIVTEATRRKVALYKEHPLKMAKYMTETCRVTTDADILMF